MLRDLLFYKDTGNWTDKVKKALDKFNPFKNTDNKKILNATGYDEAFFMLGIVGSDYIVNINTSQPIELQLRIYPNTKAYGFTINNVDVNLIDDERLAQITANAVYFFREMGEVGKMRPILKELGVNVSNEGNWEKVKTVEVDWTNYFNFTDNIIPCVNEYINFLKGNHLIFPVLSCRFDIMLRMVGLGLGSFFSVFFGFTDVSFEKYIRKLSYDRWSVGLFSRDTIDNVKLLSEMNKEGTFEIEVANETFKIINDGDVLLLLRNYPAFYNCPFNMDRGWSPHDLVKVVVLVLKGIDEFRTERVNEIIKISETFNETNPLPTQHYSKFIIHEN